MRCGIRSGIRGCTLAFLKIIFMLPDVCDELDDFRRTRITMKHYIVMPFETERLLEDAKRFIVLLLYGGAGVRLS